MLIRPLSLACERGEHTVCASCEQCPCHAVPPPDSFREARQALAEKLAARRTDTTEETP